MPSRKAPPSAKQTPSPSAQSVDVEGGGVADSRRRFVRGPRSFDFASSAMPVPVTASSRPSPPIASTSNHEFEYVADWFSIRSLAMHPRLMLFDEVTSALDPELTGEVLKAIERLASNGMTMMLVTHEMAFARSVADQVVFMHQGRVWEAGPGDMLLDPQTAELRQFVGNGL